MNDNLHYVGPETPPASRQPPVTEVGIIGWMRKNLFGSVTDSISTIITALVIILFTVEFLSWSVFSAQWEVIFLNLANLGAGPEYPKDEIWRIEYAAFMLVALTGITLGFWMRLARWLWAAIVISLALMWIIPMATVGVPEPPIHYYVAQDYDIRQSNFVADEGEEFNFTIVPLLEEAQFRVSDIDGYIEDDNSLGNSAWVTINGTAREIQRGNLDPSQFDLNVAVQIRDAEGEVLATSDYTQGVAEELRFSWEAPAQGWYTFTTVFDEENPGSMGVAWLRTEDMEVFFSTGTETEKRVEKYGPEPELDCTNCQTSSNRTDLQFRGTRTLPQYFSLQLAPYLVATRQFFLISAIVFAIGYAIGFGLKQVRERRKLVGRGLAVLWLLLLPAQLILVNQTDEVTTDDFGGLFLTLLLSVVAIIASFPIGVVLALGRQSELPIIKYLSTLFIEVVRGVPLITLLFAGRYIVPFFVDGLQDVASAIRMTIVLTIFSAAYTAEVVRGGLQIVPGGQVEAARALGLSNFHITGFIVLPQALRAVIPALMGVFVSLFKDTSLVALIGLFEILGAMRRILTDTQTGYAALQREGYLYIGIIYFIFSYLLALASRRLEQSGSGATRAQQL